MSSRKTANSASFSSPYKSGSSLHLWNDAPILILVFSPARSSSLFLHCFSSSVFVFLLFDEDSGGTCFGSVVVVCSLPLFTVWAWSIWPGKSRHCVCAGGGALPSMLSVREEGCQQCMHGNNWHFSDTPLCSDWFYWAGRGGFLLIKLQPLGGSTDSGFLHSWPVSYSTVRS